MAVNNNPFDINKATALQANHRYFELADYLSQHNNGNKYQRQLGYEQIVALRQQGRMYNALYNKANNKYLYIKVEIPKIRYTKYS